MYIGLLMEIADIIGPSQVIAVLMKQMTPKQMHSAAAELRSMQAWPYNAASTAELYGSTADALEKFAIEREQTA